MVHMRVLEVYINFALIYISDHIFSVIPIKDLINEEGEPTMTYKLATSMKTSISHLHVLFFPCVLWKATAHVGTKTLKMLHQSQKYFCGILVGIAQHQKGCLVYVPQKLKIVSSYNVF